MFLEHRVSCIITTFNEPYEVLARSVRSALDCSSILSEILIVDDGSETDVSDRVALSLESSTRIPLKLLKKKNGGPSSARNFGIENAVGDWIIFLDADDILLREGLEAKVNKVSALDSSLLGGIYGGFVWSHTREVQSFVVSSKPANTDSVGVIGLVPGGVPSYILRKSALVEVGCFDKALDFNEDIDLLLRMIDAGWKFYGVSQPGFIRTTSPSSHTRANKRKALSGSRSFLRKAWNKELLSKREVVRRYFVNLLSTLKALVLDLSR
ncbi:glycosyltransferase family 2 protein [Marinobacter sp. SBS5]|uniref:glycosyltransferase family 2 protein n=1 Tax=Marinobacter sp. SBS5 TaxID=3401754 RepID=UPI003AADC5B2